MKVFFWKEGNKELEIIIPSEKRSFSQSCVQLLLMLYSLRHLLRAGSTGGSSRVIASAGNAAIDTIGRASDAVDTAASNMILRRAGIDVDAADAAAGHPITTTSASLRDANEDTALDSIATSSAQYLQSHVDVFVPSNKI